MKGFLGVPAYVAGEGIVRTNVGFANGRIAYIGDRGEGIEPIATLGEGEVLLPGFLDEHIHGAAGADAMDGSEEALSTIARALAAEGTVGFLATTMTQSPENITRALSAVSAYRASEHRAGAELLGAHLEGPFISPKHVGAQPLEYVAPPSVELFEKYQAASGDAVRIVTMAPELPGAQALVHFLSKSGVVVSVGHTDASYADVADAISWGARGVTHTYNAQKGLHHREIGTVGAALLRDELRCELICDTIHVSVPALRLVIKNKPHTGVTLITDAMRAKAMPDGESELGGQKVFVKNGQARLCDGTLAGSVLKMNEAVRNLVTRCGVSLTDAVDFATINPATTLGVANRLGSLSPGKDASLTVLRPDFTVALTLRAGEVIYRG